MDYQNQQDQRTHKSMTFVHKKTGVVLHVTKADITGVNVDAIVNPTTERLSNGTGLSKRIAEAAGSSLYMECKAFIQKHGALNISQNCVTSAGKLKARKVIHTVGPIWVPGSEERSCRELWDTFRNILDTCDKYRFQSVAIPPIGSGLTGMPQSKVADILTSAIAGFLKTNQKTSSLQQIYLVAVRDEMISLLTQHLKELAQEGDIVECLISSSGNQSKFICSCIGSSPFGNQPKGGQINANEFETIGNQPEGTMTVNSLKASLPGHEQCGTIEIHYNIPSGIQTEAHPNPGQNYKGVHYTGYLPDSKEGNRVLALLESAFKARLTFTVGQCESTGQDNMVMWNGISHKTSPYGGIEGGGYPDPDYLTNVQKELADKGIR